MEKKYLDLHDIHVYTLATEISDEIYSIVSSWDWFQKRTLGAQFIDAVDSIAGNIAEGFGRFHKKDKEKFYYIARGSVLESIHWLERAEKRKLIDKDECQILENKFKILPKELNILIRITEEKLRK